MYLCMHAHKHAGIYLLEGGVRSIGISHPFLEFYIYRSSAPGKCPWALTLVWSKLSPCMEECCHVWLFKQCLHGFVHIIHLVAHCGKLVD